LNEWEVRNICNDEEASVVGMGLGERTTIPVPRWPSLALRNGEKIKIEIDPKSESGVVATRFHGRYGICQTLCNSEISFPMCIK